MCCLIKCYKHFTHILLILITTSRNRSCYSSHLYTQGNGTRGLLSISLRATQLVAVPAGFALGGLTMEAVVGTTPRLLAVPALYSLLKQQGLWWQVSLREPARGCYPGSWSSSLSALLPPGKSLHDFLAGVIWCVAGAGLWGARGSELSPSREDSFIRGTGWLLEPQEPFVTWQR